MSIRAVIFDLDGTLLDTLSDLTYAVNLVMKNHGLPPHTKEEVASYVGDGAAMLIKRAFPSNTEESKLAAAVEEYKKLYLENMLRESAPFEGVCALLDRLKSDGILTAVVSNKYYVSTARLCANFFPQLDGTMGEAEERGIRRKPHPDMLFEMLRLLKITADEAIYVGDSEVDAELARRAGVRLVSVSWGMRSREQLLEAGAEYVADSACELFDMISDISESPNVR